MTSSNSPKSLTNERSARVLAALVLATLTAAWLTDARWALPWIAAGFVVRALWGQRFSVYARLAAAVAGRLWAVRPVAARPKRFAQAIGAGCLTLASLLVLGGHIGLGWALAGMVGLFAGLEAAVGFCFGCWMYGHLGARGLVQPDVCIACSRPPPPSKRTERRVSATSAERAGSVPADG